MKTKKILIFFIFFIFIFNGNEESIMQENNNMQKTKVVFSNMAIPQEIISKMQGKSMPEDAKINYNELSYIKVTYYNFDGETKQGELIINKNLANEVVDIFKELYEEKYPIEKIRLIDEYNAIDEKSMEDNNTSAFCYRVIEGTNKLSNHAKGCGIDINPL